jgi:tight adherence protein C
MVYLIAVTASIAVGLIVLLVAQLIPARSAAVTRRVDEIATLTPTQAGLDRRRRHEQRVRLEEILEVVGRQLRDRAASSAATRELLVHAGYRSQRAPAIFWGSRIAAASVLAVIGGLTLPIFGVGAGITLMAGLYLGAVGYILPLLVVRSKARRRQKTLILALPDALDLLVVCVEAGLGLNQAFVRVAEEIHPLSESMAEELHLLNLEIRAGVARDEALRSLFERTGVEDIRALALMLIQADRFGTSIANALRVHSETLRDKRKQRAEEAAAKTTIKLIFPLVICIFPAMFVVLVGPGLIQIVEALSSVGG